MGSYRARHRQGTIAAFLFFGFTGILLTPAYDAGATPPPPVFGDSFALNTTAPDDFENDAAAQVATEGQGTWLAVWNSWDELGEAKIGTDGDILVARSIDARATWTAPSALNTNADSDENEDRDPQVGRRSERR